MENYDLGSVVSLEIGNKIRKIRLLQHMTIQDLADACGCSKSMISKIENSSANPSIATLSKIAKALNTKTAVLLDEELTEEDAYFPAERIIEEKFVVSEYGYRFLPLVNSKVDNTMSPLLIRGKKGEVLEHYISHDGEEYIHMISGEMIFRVGETDHHMKPSDSLYFDALVPHGMTPITDEVEYLDIVVS